MQMPDKCSCPFCDAEIDEEVTVCSVCEVVIVTCVHCGEPVRSDAAECPHCGEPPRAEGD